jgi:hypothetical protein
MTRRFDAQRPTALAVLAIVAIFAQVELDWIHRV